MIILVGNPTAQSGKNASRIARARELLDAHGLTHRFVPTLPRGGTVAVVSETLIDRAIDTAIYMGGDGTFAEVAKGILASGRAKQVKLGMLPTGTANDQGKSFGLSADEEALEGNVEVIARGAERQLDVGRLAARRGSEVVREDTFFDSAGWGMSPRVLLERNRDRQVVSQIPVVRDLYRDQMVYAGALARTFLSSYLEDQKFDAEGTVDGQPVAWKGLTDLVIKGTRIYGGMWVFDPRSQPDDGLFEVVPFVGKRDWMSKAILHLDASGRVMAGLAEVGVTHSAGLRGAHIELRFSPHRPELGLASQIDGEEFPSCSEVKVDVLPRQLRLIVPEDQAG